ncbi:MAG: NYN domain-containing protein [Gammaproteobacteria bacterium]|nr:NYN domain-containing protein [Gammaproteobacteria bacterium]
MESVFIYWDNSNIFIEAQSLAKQREVSPHAHHRVRIQFENLLRLAHADRPIKRARAAGSVPPEMEPLWDKMKDQGIDVQLFHRGGQGIGEQEMPDYFLQKCMAEDALDYKETPGIAVLLTGDGAGYQEGEGFHSTIERMHKNGWRIEVLSWKHSCKQAMREWAEENGKFIALDDFYESITFLEPSKPGYEPVPPRDAAKLDLSRRAIS